MPIFIDDGADACSMLVTEGLIPAQQKYHAKTA